MGRKVLGELEHLLLVAILRRGDDAYGAAIIGEIERRTGQELSRAGAYIALQRLERKELISARDGEQTADRGGRPRRYFELTSAGRAKLDASAASLFAMWEGLSRDAIEADSQ
ncbi:MAG: PadR family transcriptional regulator [Acidobacteria bacterium]|nr:PadR family transcriptional regulator [Acidobacteriota bacterium]